MKQLKEDKRASFLQTTVEYKHSTICQVSLERSTAKNEFPRGETPD